MKIRTFGYRDSHLAIHDLIAKKASKYFTDILFSEDIVGDLCIDLVNVKEIIPNENECPNTNKSALQIWGSCQWKDNWIDPKHFEVLLVERQTPTKLISTIAHEMTHVKQFYTGRLKQRFAGSIDNLFTYFLWDKKVYLNDTPYFERPWEIEAFLSEDFMTANFINDNLKYIKEIYGV